MAKPTPEQQAERDKAAKETLWYLAQQGNKKAKDELKKAS